MIITRNLNSIRKLEKYYPEYKKCRKALQMYQLVRGEKDNESDSI